MADVRFVQETTTPFFWDPAGKRRGTDLLWGDRVQILDDSGDFLRVRARGKSGFIQRGVLGDESLLEFYFIDVGQGDGVLIRTPDDRHILIDGGWPRKSQPTGKNAADFVDWKFKKEYGRDSIDLDAVICSHNDQDHYGGLWDLLDQDPEARRRLDVDNVTAEAIYHAGLSWWRPGDRTLGPSADTPDGKMHTRLLGDRASVEEGLAPDTPREGRLQGEWSQFLRAATETRTRGGDPTPFERLSNQTGSGSGSLPGFDDPNGVDIQVLGPVEFQVDGKPAIRKFSGGTSQNTNGNSVLLRVDFGDVRILLTGDLNERSQKALLADYEGRHEVFECDVAKACHHGSGDISTTYLTKLKPTATIISSGDSEGHDHPRPEVIAASGITGNVPEQLPELLESPYVYITELARSVTLGTPTRMEFTDDEDKTHVIEGDDFKKVKLTYEVLLAGDRNPRTRETTFQKADKTTPRQVVDFTIFGLINVRTDGERIVVAGRNEADQSWNVKEFRGRFGD